MKKSFPLKIVLTVFAASMVVPLAATASASASTSSGQYAQLTESATRAESGSARSPKTVKYTTFKPCKPARSGSASCLAIRRNTYVNGIRQHGLIPAAGTAFGAPALRKAYGITTMGARYKVIAIDYRMPPDHPYPAAMDDAMAVWKEVVKTNDPKKMAIFGTSTGGGMTLAMVLRARV